jgi:hypothetical protein
MKRVQQDGQSIRGLVTNHSLHRHTLFGAIAGLAAGIIMTPFLMLIGVIMGIDANNISKARGMALGFIMTTIML